MSTEISKKEAAAISAAIAAYLASPNPAEKAPSTSDVQKTLELLSEKVSRLEKQVESLASTVNDIKGKVERKTK